MGRVHGESYTGTQGDTTQAEMGKGQNEGGFSEEQIQMYKDCFKLMDINKDGTLGKNDLRGAFDNVGVLMTEGELDGHLGEISGPCTFDNMVKMFQEKMAEAEIDDIFGEFEIDEDYMIKTKDVISLFVAVKEEPKAEEPVVVEEAPVEEEEDADAKKKKKKKKAAK